ncbi:globin domain-containing protein [Nocardioides donggukensis]|uniref:nitric oxide dioxygenase n=1 Tax=Nocardioides donggukensis TaxID=2774019 RepID=A0A927Q1I6_9ACTN|nr:globin domain-containing protein [Nocardioides donggukensis]MBD8868771.1 hemin transporter [Nocardioides donggukensis]
MLSQTSHEIVEATLPVVGENVAEIAQRFYAHLFAEHPQLLDGVFNRGNQADGSQQQALAGSVAAFADALVNRPDRLPDHLLSRVAHKHASLGVTPDQYLVVHDHLMWAVGDVLGEAVTHEVAAAWSEVYWLMANMLINKERGLYEAVDLAPDTIWSTWRVCERIPETDDVVTLVVEPVGDEKFMASLPGQYVTVRASMPDGVRQPRQYSLTRADDGRQRRFCVKRLHGHDAEGRPDGEMSNLLHDRVAVGDELELSAPFGDVVLEYTDRPVVFATAGIGVAPMAGMLSHLAQGRARRKVRFWHADDSVATFPLREQVIADLAELPDATLTTWYLDPPVGGSGEGAGETHTGYLDVGEVDLPADAEYYLCGPLAFLKLVRADLVERGVPPRDIQYEVFGPDLWLADYQ